MEAQRVARRLANQSLHPHASREGGAVSRCRYCGADPVQSELGRCACRLDHGVLNVPLAKRGNIDAQIDRFKADEARKAVKEAQARFHDTRSKRMRVSELLQAMPDERVLTLAKPLGSRKPHTARLALARAASYNLDRWLTALEREAL